MHKKIYPLGDSLELNEIYELNKPLQENIEFKRYSVASTGIFREPKKGEWFISGAIPKGYKAPNNLSQKYYIGVPIIYRQIIDYEILSEGV